MERIDGVVRRAAWGHPTAIADLQRRDASGDPEAELWFGAHPSAPSITSDGRPLDQFIAVDPETALGAATNATSGELPFLLKVLAAAKPLSIQAHPDAAQARRGFDRENAAGIAIDAPTRTYRDPHHKPELICALSPFRALCGFRALDATRDLFDSLGAGVEAVRERLAGPGPDHEILRATVAWLLREAPPEVVTACVEACRMLDRPGFAAEAQIAIDASTHFGNDPAIVVALLLNRLTLEPGEALYLGAGNLHAYLGGVGIEVMANSDNVVRGGMTQKHVDVAEFLDVVDCHPGAPEVQRPDDWNHRYRSDAPEFVLHRYELTEGRSIVWQRDTPAIALVTAGEAWAGDERLQSGEAIFLAAADGVLLEGTAEVFLVTTR